MQLTPAPASTRSDSRSPRWRTVRHPRSVAASAVVFVMLSSGCGITATSQAQDAGTTEAVSVDEGADSDDSQATNTEVADDSVDLFDSSVVHEIEVDFDQDDYDAMIETFTSTGEKDWIAATVTVDGVVYEDVGLRLKGNSSLFGLTAETAGNPEALPWLIRFNEFVDGGDHQGYEEIVIRSNSTDTAMNEAVAQQLLDVAGLASQDPIATSFIVNDSEAVLRLAVEHPDEEWYEDHFDDEDGLLYKADSEGDYSFRGDEAEAYTDVFDQKVGDDDLDPLIDFLDFINNADDMTFADELGDRLDVEAFATYLAFQDLIGNFDDIDGPGNNSYLQYDTTTGRFTVVSWDLNLAFDTPNVGGGGGAGRPDGGGAVRPEGPGAGGPGGQSNVLAERFLADDEFSELYDAKTTELTELLFTNGIAADLIDTWTQLLVDGAPGLVSEATVESDASALTAYVASVS